MAQRPTQTTESGSPVTDHQNEFDYVVSGAIGPQAYAHHAEDDDFVQAGMLFRVMKEDARQRLIDNVAGSLAQVSRPDVVERSIEHFRKADPEYGRRLSEAVASRRGRR
jgi:catalase